MKTSNVNLHIELLETIIFATEITKWSREEAPEQWYDLYTYAVEYVALLRFVPSELVDQFARDYDMHNQLLNVEKYTFSEWLAYVNK